MSVTTAGVAAGALAAATVVVPAAAMTTTAATAIATAATMTAAIAAAATTSTATVSVVASRVGGRGKTSVLGGGTGAVTERHHENDTVHCKSSCWESMKKSFKGKGETGSLRLEPSFDRTDSPMGRGHRVLRCLSKLKIHPCFSLTRTSGRNCRMAQVNIDADYPHCSKLADYSAS